MEAREKLQSVPVKESPMRAASSLDGVSYGQGPALPASLGGPAAHAGPVVMTPMRPAASPDGVSRGHGSTEGLASPTKPPIPPKPNLV